MELDVTELKFIVFQVMRKHPSCPGKHNDDVICANVIYDVLLDAKKTIANRLAKSGTLILAGILTTQFPMVVKSYKQIGFKLLKKKHEGEWTSGAFRIDG